MRLRSVLVVFGVLLFALLAAAGAWYFMQPRTAAAQLERARRIGADATATIAALKASGRPEDAARAAEVLAHAVREFGRVAEKFPGAPEIGPADFAALSLLDSNTTPPGQRLEYIDEFLGKHPESPHAMELRWKAAEITHREQKEYLKAIGLYEEYARKYPKEERAAEAMFRVGTIYEEIKETASAVRAYEQVVKDYPKSRFADEAQFRVANLLADRMEKKQEAIKAFEKLEKEYPGSRYAAAAGGQRRKLAESEAKSEGEKYSDDYYGGVREVDPFERLGSELDSPYMKMLRRQQTDLVHTDSEITVSPADHVITGTARLHVIPAARTTDTVAFQLESPLKVLAVRQGGAPVRFSRQEDFVIADVSGAPLDADTTSVFEISYTGTNTDTWSGSIITTASTYLLHRQWVPVMGVGDCHTATISVSVPDGYVVVTQGRQTGRQAADGWTTASFAMDRPVFFYALAIAPYVSREAELTGVGGRKIALQVHLARDTPQQYFSGYLDEMKKVLPYFEENIGSYPYDKLAVAQINFFPGGLGSPGLILMGTRNFETTGVPAAFLAHEAAHMWFGNELSLDLGPDSIPWLSEGFAEYWDALYHEHDRGREAFVRHMRTVAHNYYMAVTMVKDKPIRTTMFHDPMYMSLAYKKGAFVLHALRAVVGSDTFLALMKRYVRANRGRVVTWQDFRAAAEEAHGSDLGWFFEQWLDRTGIPHCRIARALDVTAGAGPPFDTQIVIEQAGEPYRMPVEIDVETRNGHERHKTEIRDAATTLTLQSKAEPLKVTLDPDYWILKHPRTDDTEKAVTRSR